MIVWLLPCLCQCMRVVRNPGEALVLQAFGHQRGGDKLTAVVIVLLLAQGFSVHGGGRLLIRCCWHFGVLMQRRIGCSIC